MQEKCINNGGEFGGEICQGEKGSPASPPHHAWVCCRGGDFRGLLLRGEMGALPPPIIPHVAYAIQHIGSKVI